MQPAGPRSAAAAVAQRRRCRARNGFARRRDGVSPMACYGEAVAVWS